MATTALTPAASTYRSALYEWLTTTDHKKIGILYIVNSFIFFFLGGILALFVRTELAQPGLQFLADEHDLQPDLHDARLDDDLPLHHSDRSSASGTTSCRSRSARRTWPTRGSTRCRSGCSRSGGILLFLGFRDGRRRAAGWTSYAPLSEDRHAPRPGPDRTSGSSACPDRHGPIARRHQLPRHDLQDAGARA